MIFNLAELSTWGLLTYLNSELHDFNLTELDLYWMNFNLANSLLDDFYLNSLLQDDF